MVRVIFFGTPEVSVPFLKKLLESEQVAGVVTQPDRPAERGQMLRPPAAKSIALEHVIPVFQPEKYTQEAVEALKTLDAEIGIVVSYGKIIPSSVFTLFPNGCFNVHFSLLPKYRGAAPVQWALINGEKETGVTTFCIEKGLDTGPILVQKSMAIAPDDTAITLMDKLVALGITAMIDTISGYKDFKVYK
jgi:methionyl-tRNA formyltransferase